MINYIPAIGDRVEEEATMNYCMYQGRAYQPIQTVNSGIVGDSDVLCEKGDRLMFRHDRRVGSELFVAPKGELCSGFVLGLFFE